MKLFKLTALSALLMITLSGCSLNSESPEQLIKEKPVYSEASLKLYREDFTISKFFVIASTKLK